LANYRLKQEAESDLERIWFYGVERWGMEAADRYHNAFFKHFEKLAANPLLFPETDLRKGYRRSICGKESVFYRISGDTIEIMAIIGQQDAGAWL